MLEPNTILEIGSGSYKLYREGSFNLRFQSSLGKGLQGSKLASESIDIALTSLRNEILPFLLKHNIKPSEVLVFATAAIRQSANDETGRFFIEQVKACGFSEVRVFSEDDECTYAALAVIDAVNSQHYLILDTGGASHQLMEVKSKQIIRKQSIAIGSHSPVLDLPDFRRLGYTPRLPLVLLGTSAVILGGIDGLTSRILVKIIDELVTADITTRRMILESYISDESLYSLLVDFRLQILPQAFKIIYNCVNNLEIVDFIFCKTQAINYISKYGFNHQQ